MFLLSFVKKTEKDIKSLKIPYHLKKDTINLTVFNLLSYLVTCFYQILQKASQKYITPITFHKNEYLLSPAICLT